MDTLVEIWRQQRLDVSNQLECYCGGIFEDWYLWKQKRRKGADKEEGNEVVGADDGYEHSEDEEEGPAREIEDSATTSGTSEHTSTVTSLTRRANDALSHYARLLLYPAPTDVEDDSALLIEDIETEGDGIGASVGRGTVY
ncbi:hypothetical protein BC835DRAFT_300304 [Cytidiella melzeri]|nr:hypothetical protein BC835DRAFT_300304 [Cytidiella melzeri]